MMLDSFRRGLWCLVVSASMSYVGAFVAGTSPSALTPTPNRTRALESMSEHRGVLKRRRLLLCAEAGEGGQESVEPAAVLRTAVETRKAVPMAKVSEALRVLAEDGGSPLACGAEDVEGSWELVFSTQLKSGYMPIRELVGFYPSREEASIDAAAGPLPIGGMRGKCWWRGGEENELAFMLGAVKLGPFKFGKDKNEVKTYKFFVNDGKQEAARGGSRFFRASLKRGSREKQLWGIVNGGGSIDTQQYCRFTNSNLCGDNDGSSMRHWELGGVGE
ncbi:unnamed protein product [Ectocarpus sp. 12 AP-2014]